MSKKINLLFSSILFFFIDTTTLKASPGDFSEKGDGGMRIYSKSYSPSCLITFRLKAGSEGVWDVSAGGDCPLGHPIVNDMNYFGMQLLELIAHYNKESDLKKTKHLRLFIKQKSIQSPVIWAVNNSQKWPRDIFQFFENKYPSKKIGYMSKQAKVEYMDMLRSVLDGPSGFGDLYPHLAKLGCKAKIAQWFSDPFRSDLKEGFVDTNTIVREGLAKKDQLTKDLYPALLFSGVELELICE